MVRKDTKATVTVQRLGVEERVRRSEIAKEEKLGISMMPAVCSRLSLGKSPGFGGLPH
jgi:hypothetical protein